MVKFGDWMRLREMAGTFVVSPKKPKDGCGYNIWGAPGKPGGTSIEGEPIKPKKKQKKS